MSSSPTAATRPWLAPLTVLLALAVVLLYGWSLQPRYTTWEEAVQELVDGDADRAERLTCLEVVRDAGLPSAARGDALAGLCAAMAALALGDKPGYDTAARSIQGRTPYLPGGRNAPDDPAALHTATLGEPYLRTLMLALAAENRGDPKTARPLFQRAQLSALFFGAKAAAAEARAGALRCK